MPLTGFITLVDKLGEGGMGSVWVAHHAGLGSDVAVKLISREQPHDHPTLVPRFEREAVVTNAFSSPHAVQTLEHGVAKDGSPYIVMELLEGESLEARLERDNRLTLPETEQIVVQVAEVLAEARELGITHRDIKPGNIFLLPNDEIFVKVLDFGIAKMADAAGLGLTANDAFLGSPHYMSPEQITDTSEVDGRADLWSLAVVAYQALTGALPFPGDTLGQVMMAVVGREYSTPFSELTELPPALADFFLKAFAQGLDDRFQRGEELAAAFSAAAATVGNIASERVHDPELGQTMKSDAPERVQDPELGQTMNSEPPPREQQAESSQAMTGDPLQRVQDAELGQTVMYDPLSESGADAEPETTPYRPNTLSPGSVPVGPLPMQRAPWLSAVGLALLAAILVSAVALCK
jgi:serine/threonine-protein kinase